MCEAYERILTRLGLQCVIAEADTGNIGGKRSHEFHVLSKVRLLLDVLCSDWRRAGSCALGKCRIEYSRVLVPL